MYKLRYQRDQDTEWRNYVASNGKSVFNGNENVHLAVLNELEPAIIASRLRFIPVFVSEVLCTRIELYGCPFTSKSHFFGSMLVNLLYFRKFDCFRKQVRPYFEIWIVIIGLRFTSYRFSS